MTYEMPEVRDFGSIAEHTYGGISGFIKDCFPGGSGNNFNGYSGHSDEQ